MFILSLLFMQSVQYVECNQEQLILAGESINYNIEFFNVIFYEDSNRLEACRYLNEAEKIELEEEKYVLDAYYIYVDGKLLQEIIIDKKLGKQNINHVGYLHNFEKQEQKTLADYETINRNNRSFYILGFLFLLLSLGFTFLTKV